MKKEWTKPRLSMMPSLARPIETVFIVNSCDPGWKPGDGKPPWQQLGFLTRFKEFMLSRRPHSV